MSTDRALVSLTRGNEQKVLDKLFGIPPTGSAAGPKNIIGRMFVFGEDTAYTICGLVTWIGRVDDDGFLSLGTNVDAFRGTGPIRLVYQGDLGGWILATPNEYITGTCSLRIID